MSVSISDKNSLALNNNPTSSRSLAVPTAAPDTTFMPIGRSKASMRKFLAEGRLALALCEKDRLASHCDVIAGQLIGKWGRRNNGVFFMIKDEVTQYLMGIGTPAALQLLQEYETHGFPRCQR